MDTATPQPTESAQPTDGETNPLEVFAENLLVERGVLELDSEVVDGMKAELMERLELLSTQAMLNGLSDEDLAAFEKLVDAGATPAELQVFAQAKVPDMAQRMSEALHRFRLTYLGTAA
jgi:hypothetical protein